MKYFYYVLLFWGTLSFARAQKAAIFGKVEAGGKAVPFVSVGLKGTKHITTTDSMGCFFFKNISFGNYILTASCFGYSKYERELRVENEKSTYVLISLMPYPSSLDEVVVTGVTRATLTRENPVPVVSISPKTIEKTLESNIIDVLSKSVPGLNSVKTGPNISKPFIRGLGYNRVLTLFDGIRQEGQQWGDEHGIEVDAYGISKAEVIKGPASLMYGSDALAGVVSLIPFIPSNADGLHHFTYTGEYQANNNLIGNGFRWNRCGNKFLHVLNGSFRAAKNYQNAIDGRVYNTNFQEKNISLLLGRRFGNGFSNLCFSLYDNLQGIPDGSRDSATRRFTRQIFEGSSDDISKRPLVTEESLLSYKLSPLHQHIQHHKIYTHHFYKTDKGDIDLILGVQQNIRREYNHPTLPEQAGLYVRLSTLNYGLRYDAPKFANIETSFGWNGMVQGNKSLEATDFPIPDYGLQEGGVYWYAKWKKGRCIVAGGLRHDVRQIKWNDFFLKTNPTSGFDEHVDASTPNATLQFPAYKKTFGGTSASIGLTIQATNSISLKANLGRGYRAPNITEMASNGLDPGAHIIYVGNRNFNPEFSLQQDLGAGLRTKDVSGELNLFHNTIQNFIYLSLLVDGNGNPQSDDQGNKTYQYQQAVAELYGLECWFSVHPESVTGFRFDNSFSLVYGYNRKENFRGKGVQGEYLPLIPPMKGLCSLSKKIVLGSKTISFLTPTIELDYSATQNRFLGLNDTESQTLGYALANAGIATELTLSSQRRLQVYFQVNNLFDASYQSHLSRLKYLEYYSSSPNGHRGVYNMGRNVCFKLIFSI